MKSLEKGMEKWGHYLLALLCAGVILLSAAWTRDQKAQEKADQLALSDQSQRLDQAQDQTAGETLAPPVDGPVIRGFSTAPVLDGETGLWQYQDLDNAAINKGTKVKAGETLGRVQNDSPGFLRVSVQQNGEYIDFGKELDAIEENEE